MEKQKTFHVAVVGATGAVGEQMLNTLEKREFPIGKLTLLSSKRSAGKKLVFKGEEFTVQEATPESFEGVDIALFSPWWICIETISARSSKTRCDCC